MVKQKIRKIIRYKGYDYASAGAYFITINTEDRIFYFGDVVDGEMLLSDIGKIVDQELNKIPNFHKDIELPVYVIMPNHIHMIIVLNDDIFIPPNAQEIKRPTIGKIIHRFKS